MRWWSSKHTNENYRNFFSINSSHSFIRSVHGLMRKKNESLNHSRALQHSRIACFRWWFCVCSTVDDAIIDCLLSSVCLWRLWIAKIRCLHRSSTPHFNSSSSLSHSAHSTPNEFRLKEAEKLNKKTSLKEPHWLTVNFIAHTFSFSTQRKSLICSTISLLFFLPSSFSSKLCKNSLILAILTCEWVSFPFPCCLRWLHFTFSHAHNHRPSTELEHRNIFVVVRGRPKLASISSSFWCSRISFVFDRLSEYQTWRDVSIRQTEDSMRTPEAGRLFMRHKFDIYLINFLGIFSFSFSTHHRLRQKNISCLHLHCIAETWECPEFGEISQCWFNIYNSWKCSRFVSARTFTTRWTRHSSNVFVFVHSGEIRETFFRSSSSSILRRSLLLTMVSKQAEVLTLQQAETNGERRKKRISSKMFRFSFFLLLLRNLVRSSWLAQLARGIVEGSAVKKC